MALVRAALCTKREARGTSAAKRSCPHTAASFMPSRSLPVRQSSPESIGLSFWESWQPSLTFGQAKRACRDLRELALPVGVQGGLLTAGRAVLPAFAACGFEHRRP